jgi:hypothetical protein
MSWRRPSVYGGRVGADAVPQRPIPSFRQPGRLSSELGPARQPAPLGGPPKHEGRVANWYAPQARPRARVCCRVGGRRLAGFRHGRKGAARKHLIGRRAALAFVEDQHYQDGLPPLVPGGRACDAVETPALRAQQGLFRGAGRSDRRRRPERVDRPARSSGPDSLPLRRGPIVLAAERAARLRYPRPREPHGGAVRGRGAAGRASAAPRRSERDGERVRKQAQHRAARLARLPVRVCRPGDPCGEARGGVVVPVSGARDELVDEVVGGLGFTRFDAGRVRCAGRAGSSGGSGTRHGVFLRGAPTTASRPSAGCAAPGCMNSRPAP